MQPRMGKLCAMSLCPLPSGIHRCNVSKQAIVGQTLSRPALGNEIFQRSRFKVQISVEHVIHSYMDMNIDDPKIALHMPSAAGLYCMCGNLPALKSPIRGCPEAAQQMSENMTVWLGCWSIGGDWGRHCSSPAWSETWQSFYPFNLEVFSG